MFISNVFALNILNDHLAMIQIPLKANYFAEICFDLGGFSEILMILFFFDLCNILLFALSLR